MERWVYDIEVMGGNFFCVTFINVITEKVKTFTVFESINQLPELEIFLNQEIMLIGYNNISYDGVVIQYLLQNKNNKNLLQDLQNFSNSVISSEKGSYNYAIRQYQYPENIKYGQIDLMKVIEVNGNVPSLKLVGIILHWPKVQDLPFEYDKSVESLEDAKTILEYNKNDTLITLQLYRKILPQLDLREKLSSLYGIDLMSCSDSKIGDKLITKFYTQKTGETDFNLLKEKIVEYEQFPLSECMYPDIKFKTNFLKRIKREMDGTIARKVTNYKTDKLIDFAGVKYQIASGGLHSVDFPALFKSDDEYIIRDVDFSSYYPSLMIKNHVVPQHIGDAFLEILSDITKERIASKHTDKIKAFALKITINSIYGKLGFAGSWFRDNKAVLKVTIPGQLYLMMLIERFVLAGIEVISANTDGIVCRIKRSMEDKYYEIANEFSKEIGIGIEFTDYDLYARRDVNNYISRKYDGDIKYKGCYTPIPEIKKGYAHPIVPSAVYKYILEGISYEETIRNHKDILDFCISKKVDTKFQAEFHLSETDVKILQKTNRFYVSNSGGKFVKRNKEKGNTLGLYVNNVLTILNDFDKNKPFEEYDVNYNFYIEEARKLVEELTLYNKDFEPFVDEPEDFFPPTNTKEKEEFFFRYYMVKNLPENFVDGLLWLKNNFIGKDFFDFLVFATDNKKLSSKIETMIKLNYFSNFGNQKKLLQFYEEFTKGENKYTSSLSEKGKEKRIPLLLEYWKSIKDEDFSIYEQVINESSIAGFPVSKYDINKYYCYVKSIDTKKSYNPTLKLQVLRTGKEKELKVRKSVLEEHPISAGSIILCKGIEKKFRNTKDENGKWIPTNVSDMFLTCWYVLKPDDKFYT